ncbi:MAG: orotidine-5'-phosphate decarboxylase [Opitutales bacterium]|nr:orotidine-5'-phosphate decarboxylase [Opitutales bacterium]
MDVSKTKVILALDVESRTKAESILDATGESLQWVKIGLQTYLRDGPEFLHDVASSGKSIFLDLKLHDIPNTMAKAIESLASLPIKMLTLHSSAGPEALARCAQASAEFLPDTQLLAVTVLTSMNQENLHSVGVEYKIPDQVDKLAKMSTDSGIGGIVCSPHELIRLNQILPQSTVFVTPGIRPRGSVTGDQKRIMTPIQASQAGANFLVIGRPILAAENPKAALTDILQELAE